MPSIQRQVRKAQRRLWLNRWLRQWGWMLTAAAAIWICLLVVVRLFGLDWPLDYAALAALGASLVGSIIWFASTKDSAIAAAAALDEAAGLRERVSSGLDVGVDSTEPFEAAVIADAEQAVGGLTPRKFLPIRWSRSHSYGSIALLAALVSLGLPDFDLLGRRDADAKAAARAAVRRRTDAAIAKPVAVLQEVADKNPDLDLEDEAKRLEDPLGDRGDRDPDFKRRQALKQLNRLQDAIQKKTAAERFRALKETKKRLRRIGKPSDPKSELSRLMESLASGDFAAAQSEIKKLQQQLAKRSRQGALPPEKLKDMQKQLEALAKKLNEASQDQQSKQELRNAGLSEEEARRVLEALAKKDPKQLEKLAKDLAERLKKQGFSEKQLREMLKKMQQRQAANKKCKKMGENLSQCSKAMEQGDLEKAEAQLGEAGEMLSEMEQLEQALNDLDSQMAQLDQAADDLEDYDPENDDLACKQCDGSGFRPDGAPCPHCNGTGRCQGPGNRGRGTGDRDRDDDARTATVNRRAKTRQGRGGSIIGQQFVKGKQLKGESKVEFSEAAGAAEIDATDSLNRERIPRIYRKGVKRFFDRLGADFDAKKKPPVEKPKAAPATDK